jgi:Flp pilus assembly protein protease CpaA
MAQVVDFYSVIDPLMKKMPVLLKFALVCALCIGLIAVISLFIRFCSSQ